MVCLRKLDVDVFGQEDLQMTKEMPPDSAVCVLVMLFFTMCEGHRSCCQLCHALIGTPALLHKQEGHICAFC